MNVGSVIGFPEGSVSPVSANPLLMLLLCDRMLPDILHPVIWFPDMLRPIISFPDMLHPVIWLPDMLHPVISFPEMLHPVISFPDMLHPVHSMGIHKPFWLSFARRNSLYEHCQVSR